MSYNRMVKAGEYVDEPRGERQFTKVVSQTPAETERWQIKRLKEEVNECGRALMARVELHQVAVKHLDAATVLVAKVYKCSIEKAEKMIVKAAEENK